MKAVEMARRIRIAIVYFLILVAMSFTLVSCGDLLGLDDDDDDTAVLPINLSSMQQWESEALAEDISSAFADAFSNMTVSSAGASEKASSAMVNASTTWTTTCTAGGQITVNASLSGSLSDDTGTGVISASATETITDWACVSGKIMNGDPYISAVGTFSFMNWQPSTQQSVSISGGVKWGALATESCQISLTINLPTATSSTSSVSGTVCGNYVYKVF